LTLVVFDAAQEDEAGAAVDKWLSTGFTEGYDQYKVQYYCKRNCAECWQS